MRRVRLGFVLIAIIAVPALVFAQWLRYPTDGVPRNADGSPDLTAPTPRLADGKPDFSGLWHVALRNPCIAGANPLVECGRNWRVTAGGNIGRNLPGRPALSTACGGARQAANGGRQPRRSACALPARQSAASRGRATSQQSGAHTEAAGRCSTR